MAAAGNPHEEPAVNPSGRVKKVLDKTDGREQFFCETT